MRMSLLADDQSCRHDVVGTGHGLCIAQLYRVLRGCVAVVGIRDGNGELFEGKRRLTPEVGCGVRRGKVEVTGVVCWDRGGIIGLVQVEVVELGSHVHDVAHLVHRYEHTLEDGARITLEGLTIRGAHLTEHARDAVLLLTSWQHLKGRRVGKGEHV